MLPSSNIWLVDGIWVDICTRFPLFIDIPLFCTHLLPFSFFFKAVVVIIREVRLVTVLEGAVVL